jgi:hypothetical protein
MISSTEYWISSGKRMEKEESVEAATSAGDGVAAAVGVDEEETGRKLRRKLFKDETRGVLTTKKEKEKKEKYVLLYYHSLDNGEK